jgi:protein-S-isoprenylcysteine O-methyltransferase Ste14
LHPAGQTSGSQVPWRNLRAGDLLLFGVTAAELAVLVVLTPALTLVDWVYVLQHVMVLAIALTRPAPAAQDHSVPTSAAVAVAYTYPYAQVIYLQRGPGSPAWPAGGLVLVIVAAFLSLASLSALGKRFGVRPALRGLATGGPYRLVRHPMYLAYLIGDVGYNLQEWNPGTLAIVVIGWASLVYRIAAEELVLAQDPGWPAYVSRVRYRLVPGVW